MTFFFITARTVKFLKMDETKNSMFFFTIFFCFSDKRTTGTLQICIIISFPSISLLFHRYTKNLHLTVDVDVSRYRCRNGIGTVMGNGDRNGDRNGAWNGWMNGCMNGQRSEL